MKLKIDYYYNVKSITPIWHFRLAKLVQRGNRVMWFINGIIYDFDAWETDGVAWNK